jgi:hypothetical protein
MSIASQTFWIVRRGHSPEEYEDALAADDAAGRYAVTDGATESCFAGLWARLLAEGFLRGEPETAGNSLNSLAALQQRWCADVRGRQLAWYSETAIERGAFATFLGLTIREEKGAAVGGQGAEKMGREGEGETGDRRPVASSPPLPVSSSPLLSYRWKAVAVGDTCLFHTRGEELLRAFPLERAEQFDNVPKLVGSRMSAEALRQRRRLWTDGAGQSGDRLWMMTDALAQWCLAENEAGQEPWSALASHLTAPEPAERFAAWIEKLRDSGRLRNDDVTLLAISLEAP